MRPVPDIYIPFNFGRLEKFLKMIETRGVRSGSSLDAALIFPMLVYLFKADVCIDLGVYKGFTSLILAESMTQQFKKSTLISFDCDSQSLKHLGRCLQPRRNFKFIPVKGFSGRNKLSITCKKNRLVGKVRLVHIDGCHKHDEVLLDLTETLPLLAEDGVIVCHDYCKWENHDVVGAVDEFAELHKLQKFVLPNLRGAAYVVLRRNLYDYPYSGLVERVL